MKFEDVLAFLDLVVIELYSGADKATLASEIIRLRYRLETIPVDIAQKCINPIDTMLELKYEERRLGKVKRHFKVAHGGNLNTPIDPGDTVVIYGRGYLSNEQDNSAEKD